MTDAHALARLAAQAHAGAADHALLERFATDRDEAAFAALVERYGRAVLDAARALLRNEQDAEDAFQATFLVLARKAATVRAGAALGCWLHGVARRIALKVLRARGRRTRHEGSARPAPASGDDLSWREVRAIVHDELARLPEALRGPVILCHLEGLTLDEAAARLDVPRGTLRGRLDRARELLRRRLAHRGLAAAAFALPAASASAVPPLVVLGTARSAARFAADLPEPTRAAALANGAISMTATRVKLGLLLAIALGVAAGLGVAATRTPDAPPEPAPAPREAAQPARPDAPAAKLDFEEVTFVTKPSAFSNRSPETIRITADGACAYESAPSRQRNTAHKSDHTLPPERLQTLAARLKGTEWLATPVEKGPPALHAPDYTLTLKRRGPTAVSFAGEPKAYKELLHLFNSLAVQEDLLCRLESPAERSAARVELDAMVAAELREPFAPSIYAIDLNRYVPWAAELVRRPGDGQPDDVRTAVRLVGLLKLESEREALARLAGHRDRNVRVAVAQAVGRLGGEKAVPVLRQMIPDTNEAAWELIALGQIAVPTITEVIQNGTDPQQDRSYEWLIRAYIDHWADAPRPLDTPLLDAVRASTNAPKVKADRTVYHAELLKLAAEPPGPENPKVERARTDVRNLARAAEAYKARKGAYPETLAALKEAGFVAPDATLRDPWGEPYRYDPKGKRGGGAGADVWTVTPVKVEIGSWAADLWGVWVVRSAAAEEKTQRPSGGHWEFGAGAVGMYKSNNVFYRASRYSVDASTEPKRIVMMFGGKPIQGIYEVKGDTLRVAHALAWDKQPKDFEGGPGIVVWVFERQKE
ncbi:MAG: sigma-70 family RNA polymerase sigma factor [Planctomycetes bacterium]|nr:sigma-70 family RNA polymerase sigma factor [Planctomycetota bacterium]